ncbi:hypothetical protein LRAMOSA04008 [Lichtheimia ramosa]|uniref:HSF-type DNA-binding domain-containing protein n=1 Tax=Lichtheimia ramosa TaxID=688394 RepID=A0A077WWT6_9FUNG|nr:hypothetical protein LRAMOSA04008 [Lichtheimia ramosa]
MNWQNSIVNDPTNDSLIRWSGDDVVDVLDVAAFSHQILPQYFSHNNWPSFVRQLNMYGFRRVKESVLMSTNNSKAGSNDTYQFMHDYFRKNQRHLLHRIRRKPQNSAVHNLTSSTSSNHHSHSHRRSSVTHEAMERRLDLLHEQLRAVESKYAAMLNETQELHNLHSQQLKLLSSVLNTIADTHENNPVIVQLYEKLESIIGRAEATLSSPRTIQLPPLAEAVQNAPTTPTTPLLPPLQDHEIKQA